MRGQALIIRTDGYLQTVDLDHAPTVDEIHEWVNGYIELVPFFRWQGGQRCVVFCNEEGKLEGLPVNRVATELWYLQHRTTDVLVGPIVIVTGDDELLNNL